MNIDSAVTDMLFDSAAYTYDNLKDDYDPNNVHDFIIGLDLENEEDQSRPLSEYTDQLNQMRERCPSMNFYLHAGESLEVTSDNLIDAYLLGAKRVGHGFNLYHFPSLMDKYIENDICLEVCPISNQTLIYANDVREHPAVEYLKRGVPMVLGSDDPAYQEHTTLVDDWFAAIVSWGLCAAEIKQLCMNSITYSGLDETSKPAAMTAWQKQWDSFVDSFVS